MITEDYVVETSNDMVFENIDPYINNSDVIESDVVTIELTPDLMEEDYGLTTSQDNETSDVIEENIVQESSMELPLEIISESVIESDPSNEIILINHDTLTESKKDVVVIDEVNDIQSVDTGLVKVNQESKNTILSESRSIDRRGVSPDEVMRVIDQSDFLENNFSNKNLRVEILNGVGSGGIAKIAASFLKSKGIIVPRFANAGSFDYDETVIVDWKGNLDKSVALAHLLQIDPERIIVYDRPQKPLDITLVLGKDWLNKDFDNFQVVDDKKLEKVVDILVSSADSKKAEDIRVFHVAESTWIIDVMVVGVKNSIHAKAIIQELITTISGLMKEYSKDFYDPIKITGTEESGWVIIDINSIVIHCVVKDRENIMKWMQFLKIKVMFIIINMGL